MEVANIGLIKLYKLLRGKIFSLSIDKDSISLKSRQIFSTNNEIVPLLNIANIQSEKVLFIFRHINIQIHQGEQKQLTYLPWFKTIDSYTHLLSKWEHVICKYLNDNKQTILSIISEYQQLTGMTRYISHKKLMKFNRSCQENILLNSSLAAICQNYPYHKDIRDIETFLANTDKEVERLNGIFTEKALIEYCGYFNKVEKNPLRDPQRYACVCDEDNILVLAGAGSGKTSTMVGKAGYLVKSGLANSNEILLLAFGGKAKEELQDRINEKLYNSKYKIAGLHASTFHALGNKVLKSADLHVSLSIAPYSDDKKKYQKHIHNMIRKSLKDKAFSDNIIQYFISFSKPYKSVFDFEKYEDYVVYVKRHSPRTLNGDKVKSFEELSIGNFLYMNQVPHLYESPYVVNTRTPERCQYKPDFTIKSKEFDKPLFLEHFGINNIGKTNPKVPEQDYLISWEWKIATHNKYNTDLISTYSCQWQNNTWIEILTSELKKRGISLNPISAERIFDRLHELDDVDEFTILMSDFLSAFKAQQLSITQLREKIPRFPDNQRLTLFVDIFETVYENYTHFNHTNNYIDFEDMIGLSQSYIDKVNFHYKYFLVDEYQDISPGRAFFLKALLKHNTDAKLFAVGDDWQAIYGFTGSDIRLTYDFEKEFGKTVKIELDRTFRYNSSLHQLSSEFITKNERQIKKPLLLAHSDSHLPAVSIIKSRCLHVDSLVATERALTLINDRLIGEEKIASVYLIGRYGFNKPGYKENKKIFAKLKDKYPRLELTYLTAHASKGKEADYVIVLELINDTYGFPAQILNDPIKDIVMPEDLSYPFAEERRLFYVAITRAKKHVYVITQPDKASIFVSEIMDGGYDWIDDSDPDEIFFPPNHCPECKIGHIELKHGSYGFFFGCSNYPICKFSPHKCRTCEKADLDSYLVPVHKQVFFQLST